MCVGVRVLLHTHSLLLTHTHTHCQIKTWIQMMVPKIEDGNNFGVGIQEDVLGEVGKSEADAGSFLEQLSRSVENLESRTLPCYSI